MDYQRRIQRLLEACGRSDVDPRHVEALMRAGTHNGCLDHLSREQFRSEAMICIDAVEHIPDYVGLDEMADSYGIPAD